MARLSRTDLYRLTGLAPSAVTGIVRDLVASALLQEVGAAPQGTPDRLGRKQTFLEIHPSGAYAVAVHLGVRNVMVALTDLQARLFASATQAIQPEMSTREIVEEALSIARRLTATSSRPSRCIGVGVATTGPWSAAAFADRTDDDRDWDSAAIEQVFRRALGVPCTVENNIRAMALGETWFGRGRESDNLILIYLGYVIGCGITINRKVYTGSQGEAGQLGHFIVDPPGPPADADVAAAWRRSPRGGPWQRLAATLTGMSHRHCFGSCAVASERHLRSDRARGGQPRRRVSLAHRRLRRGQPGTGRLEPGAGAQSGPHRPGWP